MTMTTVFGAIVIRVVMQKWSQHIRAQLYPYEEAMKHVESHHTLRSQESNQSQRCRPNDAIQLTRYRSTSSNDHRRVTA